MESLTEWGPMRWGSLVVFNIRDAILFSPMVVYDTTRSELHGVYTEWGPMRWCSLVVFNTRGAILFSPMVVYDTTRSEATWCP